MHYMQLTNLTTRQPLFWRDGSGPAAFKRQRMHTHCYELSADLDIDHVS